VDSLGEFMAVRARDEETGARRRRRACWLTLAAAIVVASSGDALAAGFSSTGRVVLPKPPPPHRSWELVRDLHVDPHGRILRLGQQGGESTDPLPFVMVRRVLPSGVPDATFGPSGVRLIRVPLNPGKLAFPPGGGFVIAGDVEDRRHVPLGFGVLRLTPDGRRDTAFGQNGLAVVRFPGYIYATPHAVTVARTGAITVAGEADLSPGDPRAAVIRVTPSGGLSRAFRGHGRDVFAGLDLVPTAIRVDSQGRILLGSSGWRGDDFTVHRLTARGAIDRSFGADGVARAGLANPDGQSMDVCTLLIQPNGKIVVVGTSAGVTTDHPRDFTLARFTAGGALDASFGHHGAVRTQFVPSPGPTLSGSLQWAASAFRRTDGRIVVGGTTELFARRGLDFAVAEYHPDGRLDLAFHHRGWRAVDFGNGETAVGVVPLNAHQLVLAGNGLPDRPELARVNAP
jgi:uncharacterized delta-60 repeat protein